MGALSVNKAGAREEIEKEAGSSSRLLTETLQL